MEKKKEEKRCGTDLSSIVSETAARGSRRAFACQDWSMHHPNLCIRGERCTCINRHSLTHREERSRLRIYLLRADRPAGQPTDRPGPPYVCEPVPCTHVRVYP